MIERNPAGTASMHRLPQESWIGSFIIVPYTQLTRIDSTIGSGRAGLGAAQLSMRAELPMDPPQGVL